MVGSHLVEAAPGQQELIGLIPPLGSILRRVKLSLYVPLAFHRHLHNGQDQCEDILSAPGSERDVGEVDEPSAPGRD